MSIRKRLSFNELSKSTLFRQAGSGVNVDFLTCDPKRMSQVVSQTCRKFSVVSVDQVGADVGTGDQKGA